MNNLKAIKRESLKSSSNNKLRAEGYIPAILYGKKTLILIFQVKEISTIINSTLFIQVLEIDLDGKKEKLFLEILLIMLYRGAYSHRLYENRIR